MPEPERRTIEPPREAKEVFERWIAYLDREIGKHRAPRLRQELVLDNLHQLQLGSPKGGRLNFQLDSELAFNTLQLALDPANITLEAEYSEDIDLEKYAAIKPLIFFWEMFDRSPVGLNQWLGFRFRAMLGRHIFRHLGNNVRIYHGVEFVYGYNITIEDDCTIHRYVTLNDTQPLTIQKGSCIRDFATIDPAQEAGSTNCDEGPGERRAG